jgi:hypothetical protein
MLTKTKLTYSRYLELPDTDPYEHEMIAGEEFVSPSPKYRHHRLASDWRSCFRCSSMHTS